MSENPQSVSDALGPSTLLRKPRRRAGWRWVFFAAFLAAGAGIGAGIALHHRLQPVLVPNAAAAGPIEKWAAGVRRAPDFNLHDQRGTPVSLRALRGRVTIVTFIDPLCRNLCPLEAKVLNDVVRGLPGQERPAVVAVSVNPWGNSTLNFTEDALHWQLVPEWRWGVGTRTQLADVWRKFEIGVQVTTKTIVGVTVHDISHTEAAYVIDPSGHERALYVYPYLASDVRATVRRLARAS